MTEEKLQELRNLALLQLSEAISCIAHVWDHNARAAIASALHNYDTICAAKVAAAEEIMARAKRIGT